jgi:hypothetical protein
MKYVTTNAAKVSPPPCGEGLGVGVTQAGDVREKSVRSPTFGATDDDLPSHFHPTPNSCPSRGGESRLRPRYQAIDAD